GRIAVVAFAFVATFLVVLTGVAVPNARADEASDAAVLHAEALLAEMDGDPGHALELLRDAARSDPTSRAVAFDRARISSTYLDPTASDLDPFVALVPETDDERALRVYLLADRDDLDGAAALALTSIPGPATATPSSSEPTGPHAPVPGAS